MQFCLHILTDIMCELNKLNKKFQEEYVDVTSLGASIDVTINTLKRWFLRSDTFVDNTSYLSKFLDASKFGYLEICDKEGLVHRHELQFVAIPHAHGDYVGTQKQSWKPCIEGSLESCKELAKDYVQALVESLNGRFHDLDFFNFARLFIPCHYLHNVRGRDRNSKIWHEKTFLAPTTYFM